MPNELYLNPSDRSIYSEGMSVYFYYYSNNNYVL